MAGVVVRSPQAGMCRRRTEANQPQRQSDSQKTTSTSHQPSSSLFTKSTVATTLLSQLRCGKRQVDLPTRTTRAQEEPVGQQRSATNDGELCAQHQARLMRDGPSCDEIMSSVVCDLRLRAIAMLQTSLPSKDWFHFLLRHQARFHFGVLFFPHQIARQSADVLESSLNSTQ